MYLRLQADQAKGSVLDASCAAMILADSLSLVPQGFPAPSWFIPKLQGKDEVRSTFSGTVKGVLTKVSNPLSDHLIAPAILLFLVFLLVFYT